MRRRRRRRACRSRVKMSVPSKRAVPAVHQTIRVLKTWAEEQMDEVLRHRAEYDARSA